MAGTNIYAQLNVVVQNVYEQPDAKQKQLITECHSQLKTMESNAKQSGADSKRKARYETAGKAMSDAVNIFDAIDRGDTGQLVQSGLSLISNIASLAGPEGALIGAICTLLSSIFAVFQPKKESLPSQIKKIIKAELQNFKFDMLKDKGAGLSGVGQLIIEEIQYFHKEFIENGTCGYKGFEPSRLDNEYELMSELKSLAEKKFGALAECDSDKDEIKDHVRHCLTCLVGYSDIACIYIMVLSWHKILSSEMKLPTGIIDVKLEEVTDGAKAFLGFLSDKEMLGPAGWWEGKLHIMEEYRETPSFLLPIERFQQVIGLPLASYSTKDASDALKKCMSDAAAETRSYLEPKFSRADAGDDFFHRNDNHYFCLVNNTRWPVCVFSGLIASNRNLLEFRDEIQPHQILVHPCANVKKSTYFSSSGVFTVGESLKELSHMKNVQHIEFALSNPQHVWAGDYYKKILTNPVPKYSEEHLKTTYYDDLQTPFDHAKSFVYNNQFCIVKGKLKRGRDHDKEFTLYRFFIEEFDTEKLKERTKQIDFLSWFKWFKNPLS